MFKKVLILTGIAVLAAALGIAGCKSKTVEQLCSEAVQQIQDGNPNGAIVLLKNALEKNPNHLEARFQLAKAYADSQKYEQAEKEFQKVLRQNPARTEIIIELAKVHCSLNKPETAITELTEYLKQNPDSPEALEVLGTANFVAKNPEAAEINLMRALEKDPSRTSAKLELARIYASEEKTGDAKRLLDEIISADPKNSNAYYLAASIELSSGQKETALEIFKKLSALNPSDPYPRYRAAVIQIENGDMENASKTAKELIATFPKRSEGYRLRGIIAFQNKNYTDAISDFQQSQKLQPTLEGFFFLGQILFSKGDMESALSQFRIIIDRTPTFIPARIMTATILLAQKRSDDAIAEINNILKIDAHNALAHNLLGSAYLAGGKYDEGLKELNRAIELNPNLVEAHVKKGIFYINAGKLDQAETNLLTAVNVRPEILNSRLLLFSYYIQRHENEKAYSLAEEALSGEKGDAVLYNCMAAVKLKENKPSEAIGYLQKAKVTDQAFSPAYFNLAIIYASAGAYEKALKEYEEVLRRDPKNIKAMLGTASLYELKGDEDAALKSYSKARDTHDPLTFMALAGYYLRKKNPAKALSVLDEAKEIMPRNADILELKGRILLSEKNFREALNAFNDLESISRDRGIPLKISAYIAMKDISKATNEARRVITLKPNSAYGYILLSTIYETQNDLDKAIAELKNGLQMEKDNIQVMLLLGNLYARKKDYPQASSIFAEALKKKPDSAPVLFAQGSLLDITGKRKEAISKYQLALAKSDNYLPALNNLAYLYCEGFGDKKEALRMAISAFKQEPSNGGIMDTLGYALVKNGRAKEACNVLEKAASILGNNPTVHYHLALALRDSGNKVGAVDSLRKAIQMGNFPEKNIANSMLAELSK